MSASTSRKRLLSLSDNGGLAPGDFVRKITGGPVQMVTSVVDEHATVLRLEKAWGWYDIIPCAHLIRVALP